MSASNEYSDQNSTVTPDDTSDNDSALGSDASSLTESLRSSLLESVRENGRGYHRYKSALGGQYPLPEDEGEQDRLYLQHEMFLRTFNQKLFLSPLREDVRHVLDIGTGTGIWAMDFADAHPGAQVIGTDLSPIQPAFVPPNCKFEVDDFNNEWIFSHRFDFVHGRALVGSSTDYPAIIRQSYEALNPGGWLEMSDVYMPFLDEDGTMRGTMLEEWTKRQVEASAKVGVDTTACSKYRQMFLDQGFEQLGRMTMLNFLTGLEGFTLRLWTGVLGMSYDEIQVHLAAVRRDVQNPRIHSYWPVYCVYGRKPQA